MAQLTANLSANPTARELRLQCYPGPSGYDRNFIKNLSL